MAATLLSKEKPQACATGKPGQPLFRPVLEKLEEAKPPLLVFTTGRSWLIMILQPAEVAPILTNGLAWLSHHPLLWTDHDEYVRMQKWIIELQVTDDTTERVVKMPKKWHMLQGTQLSETTLSL